MAELPKHVIPNVDKFSPVDPNARVSLLIGTTNSHALETTVPIPRHHLLHETSPDHARVSPVSVPGVQTARPSTLTPNYITLPPVATARVHTHPLYPYTHTATLPPVLECSVFSHLPYDDTIGTSHDDNVFMDMLDEQVDMLPGGSIELPSPLRPNFELPDNKSASYMRSRNTMASIKLNQIKTENCRAAMQNNLEHNFLEEISPNERCPDFNKCFDNPVFPVAQSRPCKEDKIRLVYAHLPNTRE